tara:strand:- start:68756 stop:69406 length:651 start_codon:yes stop_codon:yes gene_type:complete
MAQYDGINSGLVVKSIKAAPKAKKKKKKIKPTHSEMICVNCGYESEGSPYQLKKRFYTNRNDEHVCMGCLSIFGVDGMGGGVINDSIETVRTLLERAESDEYAVILMSQKFYGSQTGVSFKVDFGDVFHIERVGTPEEPNGTSEDVKKRFTIDIKVGLDVLTLYPHEYGILTWTEIMLARKDKCYMEAYVCHEDKTGYFKPTDEFRQELISTYGDR